MSFGPKSHGSQTVEATTTPQQVTVEQAGASPSVLINNAGPSAVFVEQVFAEGDVAEVATSLPILAGTQMTLNYGSASTVKLSIVGAGDSVVYVVAGNGELSGMASSTATGV